MNGNFNEQLRLAAQAFASKQYGLAYSLYEDLAKQGHADSQVFVGWMLTEGRGVVSNVARATEWFERAAAMGSPQGAFYLARAMTAANEHETALALYKRSAAANYLPAIFWVGYANARAKGTPRDVTTAYQFLCQAESRGHIYAAREIALLDMQGNRGALRRVSGVINFSLTLAWGTLLGMFDQNSERLRA